MQQHFVRRVKSLTICAISVMLNLSGINAIAQTKTYKIDISSVRQIAPRNLPLLGGKSSQGESIAVNNYYITKAGVPIIPITGEFHFSRYPNAYWDESIKKIKAGGVNTIATYVFWNIHEEKEGVFKWDGDRDLRKFIELCAKNDIMVIVRIGPFDHGEIRNGGLPDWLLGKPLTVRTNDPLYLHYVETLYEQVGKQLKGLYYKDGGPIVGVQLENEYQHAASPWGITYPGQPYDMTVADRDRSSAQEGVGVANANNPYAELGNDHMRTLKHLAIKYGIDAPIYTATGWGYAAIIPNETLPVTAAYAYPTWTAKRELSPFYLYKDLHAMPDYAPVRYKPMDYPAFAAELGAGIMVTYSRRPTVPAESVDALINRCLGGGANGLGYYMYHGGSTPTGQEYFFSDEAYGYPKISYDFQSPIGEYGQIRPSYKRLKLLHSFINDFAPIIADKTTTLPENAGTIKADDVTDLRYAVRSDGNSGFVFLNNFQDNLKETDKKGIQLKINSANGVIQIPQNGGFNLKAEENLIIPFNLMINDCKLTYSTAQLFTKCDEAGNKYYVFFAPEGTKPEFNFAASTTSVQATGNVKVTKAGQDLIVQCPEGMPSLFSIRAHNGQQTNILVVTKKTAENANEIKIAGKKHLLFTEALMLPFEKNQELLSVGDNNLNLQIFPKTTVKPSATNGSTVPGSADKIFSNYDISLPKFTLEAKMTKTGTRKAGVVLPERMPEGLNDIFLKIDYWGDTGMGFLNNELVTDDFYRGVPWEIGLKRFIGKEDKSLNFYFRPFTKAAPFMIDLPKEVTDEAEQNKQVLKINSMSFVPEYKTIIKF